jgi:uncharacterized protein (TIRG00374 family)
LKKGILQSLKFIAFLIVGGALMWLAFRSVDFSKLAAELREADLSWLLLSVFFGFVAFLSRARRWAILIYPLGYKPTFMNSFYALMTGYLANLALPRIGEITRCVALGRKEKIPVDQLIGTVVIERTVDFISLLSITVALIITSSDDIGIFMKESILEPIEQSVVSVFGSTWVLWIALVVIGSASLGFMIGYRHSLRKIRFFAKMFDIAKGIVNGLKTITNLQHKWEFIFHTVFIWVNYALMTWVVVFSLEVTSHITFTDSIFLLVIGGLAMSAPVQSGLGAFHYIISRGLLIVEGIPLEDGLVYALLTHESQLIFVVLIGAVSFFMIFRKNNKEEAPENNS